MKAYKSDSTDRLFEAILSLRNKEECQAFFGDICTIREVVDMAQRLDIAFLIDEGISYHQISEETGVSTATISRVSRCLNYGEGGYRIVIDRTREGKK